MVIKPELAEQVYDDVPAVFEDTVKFAGFRSIRAARHQDQPNRLKIIEHWDTEDDYNAHSACRNRDDDMDRVRDHCSRCSTTCGHR